LAICLYQIAIESDLQDYVDASSIRASFHFHRCHSEFELGHYDQVKFYAKRTMELCPAMTIAVYWLALTEKVLGNMQLAEDLYMQFRSLKINPDDVQDPNASYTTGYLEGYLIEKYRSTNAHIYPHYQ